MIGSSEQNSRQIRWELRDANRRIGYLDTKARGAEQRVEEIKRHQLNFALRPNHGKGNAGHGARTLAGLAAMQRLRKQEERKVEELHEKRSNVEAYAHRKEDELQRLKAREEERNRPERQKLRGEWNRDDRSWRNDSGADRGGGRGERNQGTDRGRGRGPDRDPL